MGYELNPTTADCYEGTTCLINNFGIKDEEILHSLEADITFAKSALLKSSPVSDRFDFSHYKDIHKFLFEDIYPWAGQLRTINISKKGTLFVPCDEIEPLAERIFQRLERLNFFRDMNRAEFVDNIVDFYCSTNLLHPFREGNGRTQRIFIEELINSCGYDFDFADIDPDDLMIATIHAANGVEVYLRDLFENAIEESQGFTQSM